MRMRRLFAAVVVAMASLGAAAAHAEEGFTTANVNMRTGPDIDFPSIGVIPEGDPIYVEGCLRDESWCDVQWEDERGWVYSEYLAFDYRGEVVPLPDMGLEVFQHTRHRFPVCRLLGPLLRRPSLVPGSRALERFQAASPRRLARTAVGAAPARLVAFGLQRAVRHAPAAGPWLEAPRARALRQA